MTTDEGEDPRDGATRGHRDEGSREGRVSVAPGPEASGDDHGDAQEEREGEPGAVLPPEPEDHVSGAEEVEGEEAHGEVVEPEPPQAIPGRARKVAEANLVLSLP